MKKKLEQSKMLFNGMTVSNYLKRKLWLKQCKRVLIGGQLNKETNLDTLLTLLRKIQAKLTTKGLVTQLEISLPKSW